MVQEQEQNQAHNLVYILASLGFNNYNMGIMYNSHQFISRREGVWKMRPRDKDFRDHIPVPAWPFPKLKFHSRWSPFNDQLDSTPNVYAPEVGMANFVANDPADLPEKLKAKIVNPLDFSAIPVSDAHELPELPVASGLFTRDEAMWCDR